MGLPGMSPLTFCPLFFLVIQLPFSFSLAQENQTDILSLLAFKDHITNDPLGILSSWNESTHFCEWSGVTCGRQHQRVVALDLQSSKLVGSLSPHTGNLSFLRTLNLKNNSFSQNIPQELGSLFQLQALVLTNNSFRGEIPVNISRCSNLLRLELDGNNLTRRLPAELGSLSKLKVLNFQRNNLFGEIPSTYGNLSYLEEIYGGLNTLQGDIPNSIGKLKELKFFSFGTNNLAGTIPPSIYNLSSLTYFSVSANRLHGTLPHDLGLTLPNLEIFRIHTNQFSGPIPPTISNVSNLSLLDLGLNSFTGKVPTLEGLPKLRLLAIDFNDLANGQDDDLNFLYSLENNTIPSLGNCQDLSTLDLSQNNFSGPIPIEVISISSLSVSLNLSQNQLIGPLPSEVGKLVNLGYLDVSHNRLSGEITGSLGSCIMLETLHLEGNFFQGSIPRSLNSLRALQYLNLSYNNLTGEIPKFLADFKLLQYLDLSSNHLEGEVPMQGVFQNASAVSVSGNSKLCGGISQFNLSKCLSNESKRLKSSTKLMLIAIPCGCLGVLCVIACLLFCCLRRAKDKPASEASWELSFQRVTYGELFKATDGFSSSNLVGAGSFGSVYKGILASDGAVVAVKVFNLLRKGASKSFMAECAALINIKHRNLVKVVSACAGFDFQGNDFKALVYEFMVNGSLEEWLHPVHLSDEARNLSLIQRLRISIDVAAAIDYLQHGCHMPVVHCDLKPSNVLLDGDMTAHVGDFGLARFSQKAAHQSSSNQSSSVCINGTIGYAAPEYGMERKVSTYGDVYSYGILLLEMFTGKKPTDGMFNDKLNLHNYAKMSLPDRVVDVLDPILLRQVDKTSSGSSNEKNDTGAQKIMQCLTSIIKVGVACSAELPKDRMAISTVVAELDGIKDIILGTRRHGIGQHEIILLPA